MVLFICTVRPAPAGSGPVPWFGWSISVWRRAKIEREIPDSQILSGFVQVCAVASSFNVDEKLERPVNSVLSYRVAIGSGYIVSYNVARQGKKICLVGYIL